MSENLVRNSDWSLMSCRLFVYFFFHLRLRLRVSVSILICTSLTFHRWLKFYFLRLQIATMLPALRSTTNINRVLTQTLGVLRQHQAFRVPVQHSSAVSVLTDEQRALNLKIWPGKRWRGRAVRWTTFFSFRNSRRRSTDADRLLSDRSGGIRSFDRPF